MRRKGRTIAVIIILIGLVTFFYLSPLGIWLGYRMAGGNVDAGSETENPDMILHEYYCEMDTYNRYCGSDNPTAQKWAKTAKENADFMAKRYEQLTGIKP